MSRARLLAVLGILAALGLLGTFAYRRWLYGAPHFALSPGNTPDRALTSVQKPCPGVDLATTTPDDFPGFLGADRRGAVEERALDPDWTAHPPRLLWRKPIGAGWSSFAVVNGFAVTMEQRGEEEQVTCCDVTTGRHRWTASWNERFSVMGVGPRSTPTIAGGRVYALGAWGHLVCLDGATGAVMWERELLHDLGLHWTTENDAVRFGRANSPLVTGSLVIVPGGGAPGRRASLIAYDAASGEVRWRGGARAISYSSPACARLLGEDQILIVNEDTVSGHSSRDGAELWAHPWPGDSGTDANVSQPVVLSSNRVLLTKGYRQGAEVIELSHAEDGAIRIRRVWATSSALNTKFTNVAIRDGHAYGLSDGVLECVDLETGERRWKEGRHGHGQILRVRDLLLILGDTGSLSLVRIDPRAPGVVLGRIQALEGTTWNNPVLAGRHLLMRNATEAVCYELVTVPLIPVPLQ